MCYGWWSYIGPMIIKFMTFGVKRLGIFIMSGFVLSVVDVVKIVIYTSKDCSVIITSSKAILVQVLDLKII